MSIKSVILIAMLSVALGYVLGRSTSGGFLADRPEDNPADVPRKVVTIVIDQNQRDDLFIQLEKFAEKWQYAMRIAPTDPSNEYFRVDMWRSDIKILGAYLSNSNTFQTAFFYTESTRPVPKRYLDEEAEDLETFISQIPGATITVEE
jgi:hypothetical protein